MAPDTRAYSAGKLMLELDGKDVGILVSGEGGEPVAAVIADEADPMNVVRKHLGEITYSPIRLSFATGMGEPLYRWIADWLNGKQGAKSGALVFLDINMQELSRLEFEEAFITEFAIPALIASSKDPVRFSLTLRPGITRSKKSSGKAAGYGTKAAKALVASNFKVSIDNLVTNRVMRVDAIVVKQTIVRDDTGAVTLIPLEVPDLVFTFPESDATGFVSWFDDFAKARAGEIGERNGTLQMLGTDMVSAPFTLTLSNLGVYRIERGRSDSSVDSVATARVSVYCEQIGFSFVA
jgi:T4-like virus tail tube protein gp19